ncbi:MAG: DNA helicase RecQ [Chitinophagales bacterium]
MEGIATDKIQEALAKNFGFTSFKGRQLPIIKSVLNNTDTVVIMPTGGGKSLCYQLPAILNKGTAIIISPLIALMKNQVDMMRGYSSSDEIAHFMNSSLSRTQLKKVKQDLLDEKTKMLYVAPETLTKAETIEFFKQLHISFIAVDEAHCISEWGHDFRPEYRRIREMVDEINPDVPIIALTATATPKVREDITKNLHMVRPDVYVSSFNRDNLYYEIRPKGKKEQVSRQIVQFVKQNEGKSGIIYCLNRKTTEEIAEVLMANGIRAAAYHAGLDASTRSDRQDNFLMEDVEVIVATIAFGMGIDKPDVRFVIHYNMPKSLENYYQETGRAGRDGLEGNCLGFFSYRDMNKLEKFMRDKSVAEREVGGQHLEEVVNYSELAGCRREFLLNYFGEKYVCDRTGMCDNCRTPREQIETKDEVVLALESVLALRENFTTKYVIQFLLGSDTQEMKDFRHDQLPQYGKGKHKDKIFWRSVIIQILLTGLLRKDIENYGLLKVEPLGYEFLKKPYSVEVAMNHNFAEEIQNYTAIQQRTGALDPTLYKMLKDLRKEVAKAKNVPTYVVFQDRSLEEMSTYYPVSRKELAKITGVSDGKARKYGRKFYQLIALYVEDNDIDRADDFIVKSVATKSRDKIFIIQNIDKKIPLEAIASNVSLSMDDLLTEIEKIVDSGTKLNIDYHINNYLDEDLQDEVFDYFMEADNNTIRSAMQVLNEDEDFSEEDIRLMRIKFMSEVAH